MCAVECGFHFNWYQNVEMVQIQILFTGTWQNNVHIWVDTPLYKSFVNHLPVCKTTTTKAHLPKMCTRFDPVLTSKHSHLNRPSVCLSLSTTMVRLNLLTELWQSSLGKKKKSKNHTELSIHQLFCKQSSLPTAPSLLPRPTTPRISLVCLTQGWTVTSSSPQWGTADWN